MRLTDSLLIGKVEVIDQDGFISFDRLKNLPVMPVGLGGTGANNAPAALANLGAIPSSGGSMSGYLVLNADPTIPMHAATKQYVDMMKQGLDPKDSVRVATTHNITLSGLQPIDGVSVSNGDRVLVKDQTDSTQNGIYNASSVAWARATDADTSNKVNSGMYTWVEEGSDNKVTQWILITPGAISLGSTQLKFSPLNGADAIVAGDGLSRSGAVIRAVGTPSRISVGQNSIDIASDYIGQSSIRTVGNINSGSWSGDAIPVSNGGTGATNASNALANLGATPISHVGSGGIAHSLVTTMGHGFMSNLDKSKLDGIATGATANSTDASLRDRATHTGTQSINTIANLQSNLDSLAAKASTPQWRGTVDLSVDFLTLAPGFYTYAPASNVHANAPPVSYAYGFIIVEPSAAGQTGFIRVVPDTKSAISYCRHRWNNNSWSDWIPEAGLYVSNMWSASQDMSVATGVASWNLSSNDNESNINLYSAVSGKTLRLVSNHYSERGFYDVEKNRWILRFDANNISVFESPGIYNNGPLTNVGDVSLSSNLTVNGQATFVGNFVVNNKTAVFNAGANFGGQLTVVGDFVVNNKTAVFNAGANFAGSVSSINPINANITGNSYGVVFNDSRTVNSNPNAYSKVANFEFKESAVIGNPPVTSNGTFCHIMTVAGWASSDNSGGWPTQLSIGPTGIAFRSGTSTDTWGSWNKMAVEGQTPSFSGQNILGDGTTVYGPNSTWGAKLVVGGNGTSTAPGIASICTTNGNLHVDAAKESGGAATYLNFYGGTGGIKFGNGQSSVVATVDQYGNSSFNNGQFSSNLNVGGNFTAPNTMVYRGNVSIDNINSATANGFYRVDLPYESQSLLTFNSTGSSPGPVQMIYTYQGNFGFRNNTDGTPGNWTPWKYILHTGNWNSYAPSLTGAGANGTWNISINGNAPWSGITGKPTSIEGYDIRNAVSLMSDGGESIQVSGDWDSPRKTGFFRGQSMSNAPDGGWWYVINQAHNASYTSDGWRAQTAIAFGSGNSYSAGTMLNRVSTGGSSYTPWRVVVDHTNIGQYAPSLSGAGANGTWNINIYGASEASGRLVTPRNINGVPFNGTADISVPYWASVYMPANSNFNDYKTPGLYRCDSSAYVQTMANRPTDLAFTMRVQSHAGICQEVIEYMAGNHRSYRRNFYDGSWGPWSETYNQSNPIVSPAVNCGINDGQYSLKITNNGGQGDGGVAGVIFECAGLWARKLHLRSDGYFGLSNVSSDVWRWFVAPNGDMTASGNVIAYSDERLKKNWRSLPVDFINRLAKVKYGIYDRIDSDMTQVGVSAQSLRNVMPNAVSVAQDGETLQVAYGNAAMASAVALAEEVVDLRERIAQLEAMVAKLVG